MSDGNDIECVAFQRYVKHICIVNVWDMNITFCFMSNIIIY